MSNLYEISVQLVNNWRASDGGYTAAAVDVIHLGSRLDEEFEKLAHASREEIVEEIDDLKDSLRSSRLTGAEMRLIEAQIKRLNNLLSGGHQKTTQIVWNGYDGYIDINSSGDYDIVRHADGSATLYTRRGAFNSFPVVEIDNASEPTKDGKMVLFVTDDLRIFREA